MLLQVARRLQRSSIGCFNVATTRPAMFARNSIGSLLMVKIRQPSHEFTFGVGISFIPYPLVLTPVV
jgi:hypothetical protein